MNGPFERPISCTTIAVLNATRNAHAEVRAPEKRVLKINTKKLMDTALEVMHHVGLTPGSTTKTKRDQIQVMLFDAARTAVLDGPPKPQCVDINDYAFSLIDVHALILHANKTGLSHLAHGL